MAITQENGTADESAEDLWIRSPQAEADDRHLVAATEKNG